MTGDHTYDVIEVDWQRAGSLEEELASEREGRLRLLAEFDNYRRRTRQEHAVAEQKGKREILLAELSLSSGNPKIRKFTFASDRVEIICTSGERWSELGLRGAIQMISKSVRVFLTSFLILGLFSATSAETRIYKDKRLHYGLELPSRSWRIVKRSGIAPRTEFVRGTKSPVVLRIRRMYETGSFSDIVQNQRRWDGSHLPGYIAVSDETFEGHLAGIKYSYEYSRRGIVTARVTYYLEAKHNFIYRLQFTGPRNKVSKLREEVDFIAQSFRPT